MDKAAVFTPATVFPAECARVGITTCKLCGAAVLIDSRDEFDVMQLHIDWHEARKGEGGDELRRIDSTTT